MPNNTFSDLKECLNMQREEEVKSVFTKVFNFTLNTVFNTDALTEHCLFEFKYDRSFQSIEGKSKTFAQSLYYLHHLFEQGELIPSYICIANKREACIIETDVFKHLYTSKKIDTFEVWNEAPSSPHQVLIDKVKSIKEVNEVYVYSYANDADLLEFGLDLTKILEGRGRVSKQRITQRNIEKVWTIWCNHFEDYIKNDPKHKPTFYFYIDIQKDRTYVVEKVGNNSKVCFLFDSNNGDSKIVMLPTSEYEDFWNRFKKLEDRETIEAIQQKIYRLENTDIKKFQGMFYTPRKLSIHALELLEDKLGTEFWKNGEWRIWDMCAGTGNLEYDFPEELIRKTYFSTLEYDEVRYCKDLFPTALDIFQYDYLNDDIDILRALLVAEFDSLKMPEKLSNDLHNPNIKWLIFINPPYAEASESKASGVKRKTGVNDSKVCEWMKDAGFGKSGHELYFQFLYRIFKEMPKDRTYLGMFSTPKYLNGSYSRELRQKVFKAEFLDGFVVNSRSFSQCKGKFPICFALWNLANEMFLDNQEIKFEIFDEYLEGIKVFYEPTKTINEWFVREKNTKIFVPFSSALKEKEQTSNDVRDRVYEDFIGFIASGSPDVQNNNYTCFLSTPMGGHIGTSINMSNLKKAMIINAVRNLVTSNWLNNKDQYSVPCCDIPDDFYLDCLLFDLFDSSNQTASIRNVNYKGNVYDVVNNFFPFKKEALNINSRISNSIISNEITHENLSTEAKEVYDAGLKIYKYFFNHINEIDKTRFRIDQIDYRVGWYQIKNSLVALNKTEVNKMIDECKLKLNVLGRKIYPKIYEFGFLK